MEYYNYLYSFPYIVFFVVLFLFSIKNSNSGNTLALKAYNNLSLYTLFYIFIFFIGFRGFIYTDWGAYYKFFEETPTFFSTQGIIDNFYQQYSMWNIGFLFFSMLCKSISSNYFFFQVVSFLFDFVILYYFFKRYFSDINIIFMAFCFFFLFGGVLGFGIEINLMRNAKAIMCFLISINYIEERKITRFLILNIIGFTFHGIALLFLPLYFILNIKYSRKLIFFLFVIGNIFYLLEIHWVKELLQVINNTVYTPFYELIEVYLRMEKYSGAWGFSIGYFERIFSFSIIFYYEKKLLSYYIHNKIIINAFYIFIFIYLYFSEMSILLNRVGLLFVFGYWILFPQIYLILSKKGKAFFLIIFLLYGLIKCITCNNLYFYYENALLPHNSYEKRYQMMDEFSNYLDDKIE